MGWIWSTWGFISGPSLASHELGDLDCILHPPGLPLPGVLWEQEHKLGSHIDLMEIPMHASRYMSCQLISQGSSFLPCKVSAILLPVQDAMRTMWNCIRRASVTINDWMHESTSFPSQIVPGPLRGSFLADASHRHIRGHYSYKVTALHLAATVFQALPM